MQHKMINYFHVSGPQIIFQNKFGARTSFLVMQLQKKPFFKVWVTCTWDRLGFEPLTPKM